MERMIPKKIHYVWLSDNPLPHLAKLCIDSWKRHCPDYEIVHWNMEKSREIIERVKFVREAVELKRWTWASECIRLWAVYSEGGIYFDSDVYLFQSFDEFLENEYFTNIEFTVHFQKNKSWKMLNADGTKKDNSKITLPGLAFQAAIFGARANHPFLKNCMSYYENSNFILPNGKLNTENISPHVYAHTAQEYGFLYKDKLQKLKEGITVYPSNVFLPSCIKSEFKPFAIHITTGNWRPFLQRLIRFIKRAPRKSVEEQLREYESKTPLKLPEN